jgi:hypothetical protein
MHMRSHLQYRESVYRSRDFAWGKYHQSLGSTRACLEWEKEAFVRALKNRIQSHVWQNFMSATCDQHLEW